MRNKLVFWLVVFGFLATFLVDVAEARRGRSSFGGRRSAPLRIWKKPKSPSILPKSPTKRRAVKPQREGMVNQKPRSSFGGQRTGRVGATAQRSITSSFGGKRLSSAQSYRKRYGIPRKTETVTLPASGSRQRIPARVHYYGGIGDQFMLGYLVGSVPWYWSLPLHPAFYYSRPYIVEHPDGSIEVYPGTFSWARLLLVLAGAGFAGFLVWRVVQARRRKRRFAPPSSFSA